MGKSTQKCARHPVGSRSTSAISLVILMVLILRCGGWREGGHREEASQTLFAGKAHRTSFFRSACAFMAFVSLVSFLW